MSRVGKSPIQIPEKVDFNESSGMVSVKGPLGSLSLKVKENLKVLKKDNEIFVERLDDTNSSNAMSPAADP